MSTRQSPRVVGAAVAAVAALVALAGCGENPPPGAASVVNGHRITHVAGQRADRRAVRRRPSRRPSRARGRPPRSTGCRSFSLQLLVDTELTKQYGRAIHATADPNVASGLYAQLKGGIDPLPSGARQELTQRLHRLGRRPRPS